MVTMYVYLTLALLATLGGVIGRVAGFVLLVVFAYVAFLAEKASRNSGTDMDTYFESIGADILMKAEDEGTN